MNECVNISPNVVLPKQLKGYFVKFQSVIHTSAPLNRNT